MRKAGRQNNLSADLLIRAYAAGIFPMSDSYDDPNIFWVNPEKRGILPLNSYHIPRKLKKLVRQRPFKITFNTVFKDVIDSCSEPFSGRETTWINRPIRNAVIALYRKGFAHSVECWQNENLVGGLYGISLGGAFFGESMFSRTPNASKIALVYLLAQLRLGNYKLLDTQFKTEHLAQFGAIEISSSLYLKELEEALKYQSKFYSSASPEIVESAMCQVLEFSSTQTY